MAELATDWAGQLKAERALLLKADSDIEEGRSRLHNQQELLSDLRVAGYDTTQAERLVELMQHTLVEWERHRTLIEERVNYLEQKSSPEAFGDR